MLSKLRKIKDRDRIWNEVILVKMEDVDSIIKLMPILVKNYPQTLDTVIQRLEALKQAPSNPMTIYLLVQWLPYLSKCHRNQKRSVPVHLKEALMSTLKLRTPVSAPVLFIMDLKHTEAEIGDINEKWEKAKADTRVKLFMRPLDMVSCLVHSFPNCSLLQEGTEVPVPVTGLSVEVVKKQLETLKENQKKGPQDMVWTPTSWSQFSAVIYVTLNQEIPSNLIRTWFLSTLCPDLKFGILFVDKIKKNRIVNFDKTRREDDGNTLLVVNGFDSRTINVIHGHVQ
jgi:hypothetical protein